MMLLKEIMATGLVVINTIAVAVAGENTLPSATPATLCAQKNQVSEIKDKSTWLSQQMEKIRPYVCAGNVKFSSVYDPIEDAVSIKSVATPKPLPDKSDKNYQNILRENGRSVSYGFMPFKVADIKATGLSFEVLGDGSKSFASVFLLPGNPAQYKNGYEAIFPLDDVQWHEEKLNWSDFEQNEMAWDLCLMTKDTVNAAPGAISYLAFGMGMKNYKYFTPDYSLQIRNIKLIYDTKTPSGKFEEGITTVCRKIADGKKVNVLLIGDSITDQGGEQNYAFYCAEKLKKDFKTAIEVKNMAVGGHSVRCGSIVLPRSLREMPEPDVVCMLFGANDCKSVTDQSGFNEAVFKFKIEKFIDKIRSKTGGRCSIILINGIPRLNEQRTESSGQVEKIVGAFQQAAMEKHTGFLDTFTSYLALDAKARQSLYADTIHQKDAGQKYIGDLLFQYLKSEISKIETIEPNKKESSTSSHNLAINGSFEENSTVLIKAEDMIKKGFKFEFDINKWAKGWRINATSQPGTLCFIEEKAADGKRYLRVKSNGKTFIYAQDAFPANVTYKCSFSAQGEDFEGKKATIKVHAYLYKKNDSWAGKNNFLGSVTLENNWKTFSFDVPVAGDDMIERIAFEFQGSCDLDNIEIIKKP